jgi:hypothetical protein
MKGFTMSDWPGGPTGRRQRRADAIAGPCPRKRKRDFVLSILFEPGIAADEIAGMGQEWITSGQSLHASFFTNPRKHFVQEGRMRRGRSAGFPQCFNISPGSRVSSPKSR